MKVSVSSKNLVEGLRKILNIVTVRTTMPVLNNVLLRTQNGMLSMMTTDTDVSIVTNIECDIEEEGDITLPAKKFAQIIGSFPSGDVKLVTDPTMTTEISCGQAMFKIMGLPAEDFPEPAEVQELHKIDFNKIEFGKTLKKIGYSVSTDQTRPILNGILLSIHEGSITAVATDGRRLALVEKLLDDAGNGIDGDFVLPTKVVNELQKLLEQDGDVTVRLSESHASFIIDNSVLTSKLIDGEYPNYRQVIPGAFKNSVTIPREHFAEVLNRVSMVLNDAGASVKFKLEPNHLTLSASSAEIGEAEEPLEVSYEGDPVTIAFNPAYLRDPLKNLDCDDLTIRFNDEFKPVVILGDEGFLYVIMPMRS